MNMDQEKQYIVEQRAMGQTFAQIGKELGKTEDAVRMVFNRIVNTDLKDFASPKTTTERCVYCGRPLTKNHKGEKRKFCSSRCRNAWWNEKRRKVPYKNICEHCGRAFISFGNPDRRFCSRKCFMESRRANGMEVLHE